MLAFIGQDTFNMSEPVPAYTGWAYTAYVSFLCIYVATLITLSFYGTHRYILVYLYYKYKKNRPKCAARFDELPTICVQLPMYNERFVAKRIIEHACMLDYPRDRLHIQVLDDSTDETVQIASAIVEQYRARGYHIDYVHRKDRVGFKAGALENGLKFTDAEFIAIFDADFIPQPDVLQRAIHYFADPKVGMVQARWDHLNRDSSLLTQSQAILLDGHFMIEHTARNRSGRFMSFNGTAGMWRRSCIDDAGGWQHDTVTEDLDLSYRAQLRGWRFVYVPDIISPAELPPEINAFKQQQYRWTKGGAQTCRKLLPTILAAPVNRKIKLEAFFHLTSCTVYLYIVALTLMLFPALYLRIMIFPHSVVSRILFDVSLFLLATCSASAFYLCSQREIFSRWHDKIKYLPFLMALGIGISPSNALAAIEGFFRRGGEFVRTPKFGMGASADTQWRYRLKEFKHWRKSCLPFLEMGLGFYMIACLCMCVYYGRAPMSMPFLVLFACGYFYVSFTSLALRVRPSAQTADGEDLLETSTAIEPVVPANESSPATPVPVPASTRPAAPQR